MKERQNQSTFKDFINLKKLWPYLRDHQKLLALSFLGIPIISVIHLLGPFFLKNAIDEGISRNNTQQLYFYSGLFLSMLILEYVTRVSQSMLSTYLVQNMILKLRMKTISHIMKLSPRYHDKALSGALVTRATGDFDNLSESLTQGVFQSLVDFVVLIGCIVGMFLLNYKLAIIATMILPLVVYLIQQFSRSMKLAMLDARSYVAKMNAFAQECFMGIATIKVLGAEQEAIDKFDLINQKFKKSQMRSVKADAILFAILDGATAVTIGVLLWFVVNVFSPNLLSAGVIIAFVRYVQQMFEPIKQLGSTMTMLQSVFTAIERIFSVLDQRDFIAGDQSVILQEGSISFKKVSFSYQKSEKPILNEIDFMVPAKTSLALVGKTGSGKSTIIKLLSKLYQGYEGGIYVDGHEIADLDPIGLRAQMAIVPQDIILFDGSIYFNISLDREQVTEDDVHKAARLVGLEDFIEKLPGGYNFHVKEQGANLSHGQKQLINFARALATNPQIIILDEATSVIDPQTEKQVQHAIDSILKERTVIFIAHRLSTITSCDQIILLKDGHIIEKGTHQNLLAQRGEYAGLLGVLPAFSQSS